MNGLDYALVMFFTLILVEELIQRKRPIGTHKWNRLIKYSFAYCRPDELKAVCKQNGLITKGEISWKMTILGSNWIEKPGAPCYMIAAVKQ